MSTDFIQQTGHAVYTEYEEIAERTMYEESLTEMLAMVPGSGASSVVVDASTEQVKFNHVEMTDYHRLIGAGVVGSDERLEGKEEKFRFYQDVFKFDVVRHAVKSETKFDARYSQLQFDFMRKAAPELGRWMARFVDDGTIHLIGGLDMNMTVDGLPRNLQFADYNVADWWKEQTFKYSDLKFNDNLLLPTSNRRVLLKAGGALDSKNGNDTLTKDDVIQYEHFVKLVNFARVRGVKPIRPVKGLPIAPGAQYIAIVSPQTFQELASDEKIMAMQQATHPRSETHVIWSGNQFLHLGGCFVMEWDRTITTYRAPVGGRYGTKKDLHGNQIILLGANALQRYVSGVEFEVRDFDYGNYSGVAARLKFGGKRYQGEVDNTIDRLSRQDLNVVNAWVVNRNQDEISETYGSK